MTKREYYLENVYGGIIPNKIIITPDGEQEVQMTEAEFDEMIENSLEIEERETNKEYIAQRVGEYPFDEDQLDAIYKGFKAIKDSGLIDLGEDCNQWIDSITTIKEKYPKN